MKNNFKLMAVIFFVMGIAASTIAQTGVSASASTNATIVTPITITKTSDMYFGNVAVNSNSGTVVLTPAGARTNTGGVTLPAVTGTVSAAAFTVTGQTGYVYTITLPTTITLTGTPSGTMTVNTFTSNPTPTGTLTGGTSNLTVGATLNVGASQTAGTYTNASDLTVTVDYQ
jgi:hypothetical protein